MNGDLRACLMIAGIFFVGCIIMIIACTIFEFLYDIWEAHTKHKPVYFPNWDDEEGLD